MSNGAPIVTSGTPFTVSGTPVTNQLGVGGVAGNAITIAGLTIAPTQPGWSLVSSEGGPGLASGRWQFGSGARQDPGVLPAQGAFYRSGTGVGSGGSDGADLFGDTYGSQVQGFRLTKTGWILIGLLATLLLTDRKNR